MDNETEKFVQTCRDLQKQYGHGKFPPADLDAATALLNSTLYSMDAQRQDIYMSRAFDRNAFGDITPYGGFVGFAAACAGLLVKLSKREGTTAIDPGKSLFFVYALYWHLGNDFLAGNVIERQLRSAGEPPRFTVDEWPGYAIWREMWDLWCNHYRGKYDRTWDVFPKPSFKSELAFQ